MRARPFTLRFALVGVMLALFALSTGAFAAAGDSPPGNAAPANAPLDEADTAAGGSLLEVVGQLGGPSYAVEIQGDYAYVGVGVRLVVLDISDPSQPAVLGQSEVLQNFPLDIEVSGNHAYVTFATNPEFLVSIPDVAILDISDPAAPQLVGTHPMRGPANRIAVGGNYAYVTEGGIWLDAGGYTDSGLRILDVSDPAAPVEVGFYRILIPANSVEEVVDVQVVGGYAYVIANYYRAGGDKGELYILDLSNPTAPVQVGVLTGLKRTTALAVAGNYVYIGDFSPDLTLSSAVRVVDVSNPAAPRQVGSHEVEGITRDIVVAGDFLYFANSRYGSRDGLHVLNVSDPDNPRHVGIYDTPGTAMGIRVAGDYAFIADSAEGLRVVNVAELTPIEFIGNYDPGGFTLGLLVVGELGYVADGYNGLRILDLSDPARPRPLGRYPGEGVRDVAVQGDYAYLSDNLGLYILNISNPRTPTLVGHLASTDAADSIAVAGDYAYLGSNDLAIVDISNPENPRRVGTYFTPGYTGDVAVIDNYVYVADRINGNEAEGGSGLHIVDASNPAAPQRVAVHYDWAEAIAVAGSYAYVTGAGGLHILDVSDPGAPVEIGAHPAGGSAIAVTENRVYLAGGYLIILDITDPSSPYRIFAHELPRIAWDVAVVGPYVYVAYDIRGLDIFDANNVREPQPVAAYKEMGEVWGLDVMDDTAYLAAGNLHIVDVTDPATPRPLGMYDTAGTPRDVVVSGTHAYVAEGESGLQIVNVADPSAPVLAGAYDPRGWIKRLALAGNLLFFVEEADAILEPSIFRVLDVSDPASPRVIGSVEGPTPTADIAVQGNFVYLSSGGLFIFDVSNPTTPRQVGVFSAQNDTRGIYIDGDHAYLLQQERDSRDPVPGGMYVLNISDPTMPTRVRFDRTVSFPGEMTVARSYAFVAEYNTIAIFTVANPYQVRKLRQFVLPAGAAEIVAGDYLYVASSMGGLFVLSYPADEAPYIAALYLSNILK